MSKYVKQLMTDDLKRRWEGVDEALLVDVIRVDANRSVELRKRLRDKNIHLMVVKNSLARRASEGTALAPAFEGVTGTMAVVWGAEDIVSLAKEVAAIEKDDAFPNFEAKGGVMDGARLTAEEVAEVSKWPSRDELIATVAGQAIGVGSELASQLIGPAQELASQIDKLIEMKEQEGGE